MRRSWWMVAAVLVPLFARAEPGDVRALRQQVAALQLDHALALTPQQAQALLPVLQAARSELQAARAQRQAAEPALVAALSQAVSDLKATGTVSDATAQALDAARPSPGTLRADLRSTWQQARQIITPDQLQALRTVRLGVAPAAGAAAAPRRGHPGFAQRFRLARVVLSDAFLSLVQARAG